jgi:hypothetical protein
VVVTTRGLAVVCFGDGFTVFVTTLAGAVVT